MPSAFSLPIKGAEIPNNSSKSLSPSYISYSSDGTVHSIRVVPRVAIEDLPSGNVTQSFTEYISQMANNMIYTDYRNIPYMRHLDRSLDTVLYDLTGRDDIDKINSLIVNKFANSSLSITNIEVYPNREERLINIYLNFDYRGITVNAQIIKNVENKEQDIINVKVG